MAFLAVGLCWGTMIVCYQRNLLWYVGYLSSLSCLQERFFEAITYLEVEAERFRPRWLVFRWAQLHLQFFVWYLYAVVFTLKLMGTLRVKTPFGKSCKKVYDYLKK